jgi:hypothetical protein
MHECIDREIYAEKGEMERGRGREQPEEREKEWDGVEASSKIEKCKDKTEAYHT